MPNNDNATPEAIVITLTRGTRIDGQPYERGRTLAVPYLLGRELMAANKALEGEHDDIEPIDRDTSEED